MKATWSDFHTRVDEVNSYLEFLEYVEIATSVRYTQESSQKYYQLNSDLKIVLRANAFLLLYNLVEATVIGGLTAIADEVNSSSTTYSQSSERIQRVWLRGVLAKLREAGFDKICTEVEAVVEEAMKSNTLPAALSTHHLRQGALGNIDARRVREIAKRVGFSASVRAKANGGVELEKIKENRNSLAHGVKTFHECGRDYTLRQLVKMRNETVAYLEDILKNVEKYIRNREFAAVP